MNSCPLSTQVSPFNQWSPPSLWWILIIGFPPISFAIVTMRRNFVTTLRVSKQSSIRSRGAVSSHSMGSRRIRCKNKTSQETQRSLQKFLEPIGILKSFTLTIPWNLASLVKISPGIIARLHHTDQKQMVLLERAVRRVKEGTSAVLLQSGLKWEMFGWLMACYSMRNVQDTLADEAGESTRLRMEESLPNYHVDNIAWKGDNPLQHYNLFTN